MANQYDLAGRVAVVTGGAQGIGRAVTSRFAQSGAKVAIWDRDAALAEKTAAELGAKGQVLAIACDMTDFASVTAAAQATVKAAGRIDILVNNAGIGHKPQPLDTLSEEDFDRIVAINAKSVFLTAREIVPLMKARKQGAILNIASTGGVSPRPNLTWYNASKGWMITATRAMAVELAPFGIRVNAINPVAGETPLLATFMGEDTPQIRAKFLASIPIGRFSTPEDIAAAAAFLCSDEASMITGVALEVDGGRCI